ncbi:MAG: formyltransferase family protein [Pseudomonadota bacterium]
MNKIWIKLIRRNQNYKSSCDETISQFLKENDIPLEKVSAVCKREGIPVRRCYDFNENNFVKWVREVGAEVLIFTGGGLLRRPLLEATPKGVLNCHMGILPTYRGMDLPEWAILNGDLDKIGCTVHVMDTGVDTGPILKTFLVPIRREDNIRSLRSRIEYVMCLAVVKTTVDYVKGCIEPQPQSKVDGKQFFIMTESLFKVVESKLARINCTGRK